MTELFGYELRYCSVLNAFQIRQGIVTVEVVRPRKASTKRKYDWCGKYVENVNTYGLELVSLQLKQWSAFHEIDGTLIT